MFGTTRATTQRRSIERRWRIVPGADRKIRWRAWCVYRCAGREQWGNLFAHL